MIKKTEMPLMQFDDSWMDEVQGGPQAACT
jgi:hypothetical protein